MAKIYEHGDIGSKALDIDISKIVIKEIQFIKSPFNHKLYKITNYENMDITQILRKYPEEKYILEIMVTVSHDDVYFYIEIYDKDKNYKFNMEQTALKIEEYYRLKEQLLRFDIEIPSEQIIREKLIKDFVHYSHPFAFDEDYEELQPLEDALVEFLRDRFVFMDGYLDYDSEEMDEVFVKLLIDIIKKEK